MKKKLYKSNHDIKIDGVCGGIADYFDFDVTLVRLAWIFFGCLAGGGVIAYIACMIVMPREPYNRGAK